MPDNTELMLFRQLLRTDAKDARSVLVHLDADRLGRLVPVIVDVAGAGIAADDLGEAQRQLAGLGLVGAADPELQRPADRWSEFEVG